MPRNLHLDVVRRDGWFSRFLSVSRQPVLLIALVGLAFIAFSSTGLATPINYGNFPGVDVTYVGVQEDSNSGDPLPLFGPPTVSGNSLDFNPVGFSAFASGAGGNDITDGNLDFTVVAKPGKAISNLKFKEFGDTKLIGVGNDATMTAVFGDFYFDIIEVDNVGINPIQFQASMVFSPSGGTYGLGTDGGGGPFFSTRWSGLLFEDIEQRLINAGISHTLGATKVKVNLDNTLMALSQAGTSALIAKKDHVIISTNVPEPAAWCLALIGIVATMFVRRNH
jgi:hypothetical protein